MDNTNQFINLMRNQILAHLRQTLNAYKTSKLRLLGAFHVLYQNLVLIAFHSFITHEHKLKFEA